jgi:predicted nucleic acid-binding protein
MEGGCAAHPAGPAVRARKQVRRPARSPEGSSPRGLSRKTLCLTLSSVLLEVESFRALARRTPEAITRLPPVLDLIDLVDLGPGIRILAQTVTPATVRSLDAIHLATALGIRGQLSSFVTYDKRLADAAAMAGLTVDAPT